MSNNPYQPQGQNYANPPQQPANNPYVQQQPVNNPYVQQQPVSNPYVQQPRNPYQPNGGNFQKPPKKKKWPIVLAVIAGLLVIGAIGSIVSPKTEESNEKPSSSASETSTASESSAEASEDSSESSASTESTSSDEAYFADNVLQTDSIRIEITDYKVIMPGEEGNEYGDEPVIAFWYETTNISGKEISAMSAWIMTFTAVQDNDPNKVNDLSVASLPDDRFLQSQSQTIKQGGTVENAMAYTLTDTTTPVTLTAKENLFLDDIGSQTFNIE